MSNNYGYKLNRTCSYKTAAGKLRPCRMTAGTIGATTATLKDADKVTVRSTKVRRTTPVNPTENDKWHL